MILQDWINDKLLYLDMKELIYLVKSVLQYNCFDFNIQLSDCALVCLNLAFDRRQKGEPLSKIVELKGFYNSYFITNKYTLDPRPETEFLIEKIEGKPRSILDLGVGTGCLILSILQIFNKAKGVGVDICQNALDVAFENAKILNLQKKVNFQLGNWAYGISGKFDLVVCNPPYVDENLDLSVETLYDPVLALFGNVSTYKELLLSLKNVTFHQLLMEVPCYLKNDVKDLCSIFHYTVEIFDIYNSGILCFDCRNGAS